MTPEQCRGELTEIFDQEQRLVDELLAELDREQRAIGRDPEAMSRCATAKQRLVNDLEALNRRCNRLLAERGHTTDRQGMEALLGWCDPTGHLRESWERLLTSLDEGRRRNLSNGMTLEGHFHQTRQALAILAGRPGEVETYAPDGRPGGLGGGRNLGTA